jgi:hypothetical protein
MPDNDEAAVTAADLAANRALDEHIRRAAAGSFKPTEETYVVLDDGQLSWRQAATPAAGAGEVTER